MTQKLEPPNVNDTVTGTTWNHQV